jgi:enoyl-[acyl-carrier protein] reductase II
MNAICRLFNIKYPIVQGGMIWCSGWKLASAVSNAGGLGLIGSGSMYPEILREHIQKCKKATNKPFGVNVPLLYPNIDELMKIIVEEGVKIVFTSAGNPKTWTSHLKQHGIMVVHAVSNIKFALKCQEAGVDALVAEGFEAGGHNGREETTTLVLIPMIRKAMAAAICLGADGVQVGSLFAATQESSAHQNFKEAIVKSAEGDTQLTLKQLTPVRLIKNKFFKEVDAAEKRAASIEELEQLLGRARAKKGMFEGDLEEGELEIGQVSGAIKEIKPAAQVVNDLVSDFKKAQQNIATFKFG